jgi:uncharacterized protein (DUF433 family)
MTVASIDYIDVDENGIARIVGKRVKVIQIVMDKIANHWAPEEIQAQYSYLSLAEILSAFAYYYDHQDALDAQIKQDLELADSLRDPTQKSAIKQKLREAGKTP